MYIQIYQDFDALLQDLTIHNQQFNLDGLLCENFPNTFEMSGNKSFVYHIYLIPQPKRKHMTFITLWDDFNSIQGFAMLLPHNRYNGYIIKNLCRNRRNIHTKGYGKKILNFIEKYALKCQKNYLILQPDNKYLIKYYQNLGWKFVRKSDFMAKFLKK